MICGVNIGGKDTLEEWGLMLCNDLTIGAAVPRYRFIKIPEMSGALDLTEALTGSVPYDQRTITFTLFAVHDVIAGTRSPATEEHFQTVLARFSGFANGKRLHVYLPDNPDHYFVGRVSVGGKSGYNSGRVKVEVLADPYRIKDGETTLTVDESLLGKNNVWSNDGDISELVYMFTDEIIINNEGMPAIPTINASEAGPTVTLRGASHVLAAGDNRFSDFVLQSGENVMQVEDPAGTLTIKYQEGML